MNLKELCFSLSEKTGTSGDETEAVFYTKELLDKYMNTEIDPLGNLIGRKKGEGARILLDAHIDNIGLVVRGFDEKGLILFDKIGGVDLRVLTGAEVIIHGKENLFGVVCSIPVHLQKGEAKERELSFSSLAVDAGYSKDEIIKLVEIGDRITLRSQKGLLLGENISSGSFDDRCSVACILRALELTEGKIPSLDLTVLFSTCEETGGSGAKTGAFSSDADFAIAVDVGFGDDPYTSKAETISLKKGPSIGISPILDKSLTKELKEIAKENSIPYQHDVMGGRTGTNADNISISKNGIKTALISIPLRYMHTAGEIINTEDIENTARLISAYLLKKEAQFNA